MSSASKEHFVTVVPVSEKGLIGPISGPGNSVTLGSHQGQLHSSVRTSHSGSHSRSFAAPNVTVLEVCTLDNQCILKFCFTYITL